MKSSALWGLLKAKQISQLLFVPKASARKSMRNLLAPVLTAGMHRRETEK